MSAHAESSSLASHAFKLLGIHLLSLRTHHILASEGRNNTMAISLGILTVQTEFAVDMTCQSCVNAVQESLQPLQGIERYDIDLENKRVTITGRTPPSQLLSALKSTSRQVIVRGASSLSAPSAFAQSAAVSILESPIPLPASLSTTNDATLASLPSSPTPPRQLPGMNEDEFSQKVFGISRFVQIAPKTILMDLTVRLPPAAAVGLGQGQDSSGAANGTSSKGAAYDVYISTTGNMVNPPSTTGTPLVKLGSIIPDKEGYGDLFKEITGELWEWVGRGCVVQSQQQLSSNADQGDTRANGGLRAGTIFAGVVARSSGAWGNEKTVCACSGRTMWEEGREMQSKSSL